LPHGAEGGDSKPHRLGCHWPKPHAASLVSGRRQAVLHTLFLRRCAHDRNLGISDRDRGIRGQDSHVNERIRKMKIEQSITPKGRIDPVEDGRCSPTRRDLGQPAWSNSTIS
jgi:hypothetical protein